VPGISESAPAPKIDAQTPAEDYTPAPSVRSALAAGDPARVPAMATPDVLSWLPFPGPPNPP